MEQSSNVWEGRKHCDTNERSGSATDHKWHIMVPRHEEHENDTGLFGVIFGDFCLCFRLSQWGVVANHLKKNLEVRGKGTKADWDMHLGTKVVALHGHIIREQRI